MKIWLFFHSYKRQSQNFTSDLAVKASYIVNQILAKQLKPFADGEIIKECLTAVVEIGFPDKKRYYFQN